MNVEEILAGHADSTGVPIDTVYSKVVPLYAVYRTAERVVVHFADDAGLGGEQRLALSPLNPLRGEINGLIDGWRTSELPHDQSKAKLFDRRVADALILVLQGDPKNAQLLLGAIKEDVLEERMSVARSAYLGVASATAITIILILSIITTRWYAGAVYRFSAETNILWFGAGVGAIGALFSIALNISDRSIRTDLQNRDNAVDSALRIFIGATSAAILFSLLLGELISFSVGEKKVVPGILLSNGIMNIKQAIAVVLAFAAGFSERMVSNILSTSIIGRFSKSATNPLAGGDTSQLAARTDPTANETSPLGTAAAATNGTAGPVAAAREDGDAIDDDVDGCVSEITVEPDDLTDDVELPEAIGGVEQRQA